MKLQNLLFTLEVDSMRLLYKVCGCRPSSAPYLSGDGFRSLCRHFYEGEGRRTFDPGKVDAADLVFCESWHLPEFFLGPAKDIRGPFSVISHNGDMNIDKAILSLLPSALVRLFAQNLTARDPRAAALPIGLENKRLHCNGITRDFDLLRKHPTEKLPRVLSAFSVGTNRSIRGPAAEQLSACPLCDLVTRMNSRAYRSLASHYMFVTSPPGNGADCHRTWEAMYTGSVPIVLRSAAMEDFERLGMPLCIVDSYRDVVDWNESMAVSLYEELSPRFCAASLWFDYWKDLIVGQDAAA